MNLIDAGNLMMLVEKGLGVEHAKVIADQWRAKCAEVERLGTMLNDAHNKWECCLSEIDRLRGKLNFLIEEIIDREGREGLTDHEFAEQVIALAQRAREELAKTSQDCGSAK